ncbi:uncharacterized protein LOC134267500 [Saccostrea cucullata]|uniref:uncharacterized protein LOC134267500 n=1 Tax=Saccostrea cuccullata TaxID=36930 RepID=UPI002ED3CB9C
MLTTFYLALCCLPLVCEARTYCYSYSSYGYSSYICSYYLSTADRFGIAYGTVVGIGLVVSIIIFVACKMRQKRRPPNQAILLQGYPRVAYAQLGQQVLFAPQAGLIPTAAPQGAITNPALPVTSRQPATSHNTITNPVSTPTNQQHQAQRTGTADTHRVGAEGITVRLPETEKEEGKTDDPPPYTV